jgi:hypothetical protein
MSRGASKGSLRSMAVRLSRKGNGESLISSNLVDNFIDLIPADEQFKMDVDER